MNIRIHDDAEVQMALIGYARISTADQSLDLQIEALEAFGCTKVFTDIASGARDDRPGLANALEYMRAEDVLVTWKLDRVGRSTAHLISLINDLKQRQIGFASLTEAIDTTTPAGDLLFSIMAALAQFERSIIAERTRAGLEAARARGAKPGRKPSLSADQADVVRQMNASGQHTVAAIANVVGVSRATVYRTLAAQTT